MTDPSRQTTPPAGPPRILVVHEQSAAASAGQISDHLERAGFVCRNISLDQPEDLSGVHLIVLHLSAGMDSRHVGDISSGAQAAAVPVIVVAKPAAADQLAGSLTGIRIIEISDPITSAELEQLQAEASSFLGLSPQPGDAQGLGPIQGAGSIPALSGGWGPTQWNPNATTPPSGTPSPPVRPAPVEPTMIAPRGTPPASPPASAPATWAPMATRASAGPVGIQVGDVLNHIFEVKRFIAGGGMGEVFEGVNINTDERVAIKVMLPALAADPNVIAMFRKEARTLTRLQHESLVSYRVLAEEPRLGVLYIVTEYVDGINLADALGTLNPTPADLKVLLRRLASGLRAAHDLGAIHRDISPDNVILENGRLDRPKVIDFGIAKDLDAGSATIVGDGFAGKLSYVAPEQLGDFGRSVGPWTDVYSLALVILAVATGRNVAMGGSLVDAVDRRRAGPDLSEVPSELRAILEAMLRPDPAQRIRSMDEVLVKLDLGPSARAGESASPPAAPRPASSQSSSRPIIIGGAVGLGALAVILAIFLLGRANEVATPDKGPPVVSRPAGNPAEAARAAIDSVLPQVGCSWLEIVGIQGGAEDLRVSMTGVAGSTTRAQAAVSSALEAAGLAADLDFAEVAPISQGGCSALDAYRQIRADEGDRLSVPQRQFEIQSRPDAGPGAGPGATAPVRLAIGDPALDFTVYGIDPNGELTAIFTSRGDFREMLASAAAEGLRGIEDLGNDSLKYSIDVTHQGWSGILLITGSGPFDQSTISPPLGQRGPDWVQSFSRTAAQRNWRSEMVWFRTVDREPNT